MRFKKLTSSRIIEQDGIVYDIQLEKNHYFSANGIITHNCRLKNKLQTKEFNFTNGNMGIMTGSKSVITLNLNRIVQDCYKKHFINYQKNGKACDINDTSFYEY